MNKTSICRAALLAAGAGTAHIIVLSSIEGFALPLLITALAASIAFASILAAGPNPAKLAVRRDGQGLEIRNIVSYVSKEGADFAVALTAVLVVLWPMTAIFGRAADFYCSPDVPWRIEIAASGALVVSLLRHVAGSRLSAKISRMAIYPSLFWIAPFYGFFSAPYFLGMQIVAPCPDRRVMEIFFAVAAMIAASALAEAVGSLLRGRK